MFKGTHGRHLHMIGLTSCRDEYLEFVTSYDSKDVAGFILDFALEFII